MKNQKKIPEFEFDLDYIELIRKFKKGRSTSVDKSIRNVINKEYKNSEAIFEINNNYYLTPKKKKKYYIL